MLGMRASSREVAHGFWMKVRRLCLADAVLAAYRDGIVDADLIKAQALDRLNHS